MGTRPGPSFAYRVGGAPLGLRSYPTRDVVSVVPVWQAVVESSILLNT